MLNAGSVIIPLITVLCFCTWQVECARNLAQCYPSSTEMNCFTKIVDGTLSFVDAQARCKEIDAVVPVIKDDEMQRRLETYISFLERNNGVEDSILYFWANANRVLVDNWQWINSSIINDLNASISSSGTYDVHVASLTGPTNDQPYVHLIATHPIEEWSYICEFFGADCQRQTGNILQSGEKCYVVSSGNDTGTWYNARNRCLMQGGDLASFGELSSTNINFTQWLDLSFAKRYWVGVRFLWWLWENSGVEEVNYTNWFRRYPIPLYTSDECLCVYGNSGVAGQTNGWKTIQCLADQSAGVICHKVCPNEDGQTTTEPTTICGLQLAIETPTTPTPEAENITTPLPNATDESPLPNTTTTTPLPNTTNAVPLPTISTTTTFPNTTNATPLRDAVTSTPLLNATTAAPLPNANDTIPLPTANTTITLPNTNITIPLPNTNTTKPFQTANTTIPLPNVTTTIQLPTANTTIPLPNVTTTTQLPTANTTITLPNTNTTTTSQQPRRTTPPLTTSHSLANQSSASSTESLAETQPTSSFDQPTTKRYTKPLTTPDQPQECHCPLSPSCPPTDDKCNKTIECQPDGTNLTAGLGLYSEGVVKAELYVRYEKCCPKNVVWGVVVTLRNGSRWLIHDPLCNDDKCQMVVVNASCMSSEWDLLSDKNVANSVVSDYVQTGNSVQTDCSESSRRMINLP